MIVFRKQEKIVSARDRLGHVRQLLQNASDNITQHERVVELFIEFGEFESAVIDVLCMEADDEHPLERLLRTTAIAIGEALYRSWNADKDALACALSCSGVLLNQIEASALPDKICSRVSEGFVHYGIVPETYLWRQRNSVGSSGQSALSHRNSKHRVSPFGGRCCCYAGIGMQCGDMDCAPQGTPFRPENPDHIPHGGKITVAPGMEIPRRRRGPRIKRVVIVCNGAPALSMGARGR